MVFYPKWLKTYYDMVRSVFSILKTFLHAYLSLKSIFQSKNAFVWVIQWFAMFISILEVRPIWCKAKWSVWPKYKRWQWKPFTERKFQTINWIQGVIHSIKWLEHMYFKHKLVIKIIKYELKNYVSCDMYRAKLYQAEVTDRHVVSHFLLRNIHVLLTQLSGCIFPLRSITHIIQRKFKWKFSNGIFSRTLQISAMYINHELLNQPLIQ